MADPRDSAEIDALLREAYRRGYNDRAEERDYDPPLGQGPRSDHRPHGDRWPHAGDLRRRVPRPDGVVTVEHLAEKDAGREHDFLPVAGHPDDDECTHRADGTDATYCGRTRAEHDHHPNCYQSTGRIPEDLPSDLCDCQVLRMIDATTRPLPPEVCSTCAQSFDSPPCSLNRDTGWSGHTAAGGVTAGDTAPPPPAIDQETHHG